MTAADRKMFTLDDFHRMIDEIGKDHPNPRMRAAYAAMSFGMSVASAGNCTLTPKLAAELANEAIPE